MTRIDKSKPVLVTGATGYVAGWIVKRLLIEGMTVHAAVRDPANAEKLRYLNAMARGTVGHIEYFESDLLEVGSYGVAIQGCELVFHTASPFTLTVEDAQRDLIDPALRGTRNVLEQARKTESVKRVVVTSSVAAIYGDAADLQDLDHDRFTEEDWNTTSTPTHQPYSYSKTVAEREAWRIAASQDRWDLVTINPSFVLGPGINPFATSESFTLLKQMGSGAMRSGVPAFPIGAVDVRDVAQAHFRAGFYPSARGRYLVSAHETDFAEVAGLLRQRFGNDYPLPRRTLPAWLVWLMGPLVDKSLSRQMVSRNLGHPWRADNSKSMGDLGLHYRSLETALCDMFQQQIDHGVISQAT